MIDRAEIERMKGDELINLARVLKVPITKRTIQRSWLIDEIIEQMPDSPSRPELKDPAIQLEGVTKNFGKICAVNRLNLKVHPGEILGLVGPNGAGKTTTLRILTGIIRATSGEIHVNGHDIRKDPIKAKASIGYIPEKPTCYPSLTAREYVAFVARVYGVPHETAQTLL
jgi:ABC-type uncharacterized transport system ATPase subunit